MDAVDVSGSRVRDMGGDSDSNLVDCTKGLELVGMLIARWGTDVGWVVPLVWGRIRCEVRRRGLATSTSVIGSICDSALASSSAV